jgi:hypothetical protein
MPPDAHSAKAAHGTSDRALGFQPHVESGFRLTDLPFSAHGQELFFLADSLPDNQMVRGFLQRSEVLRP